MKGKINNKRISSLRLVLIVFLLILTNLGFVINNNTSFYPPLNNTEYDVLNLPKTSAGEITITTPENRTYYGPMKGFHPATYGFENELDGISGETIDYIDSASISSSCEVKIYDEYQGHKKVLRVHDGNGAGNAGAQDNFASTQTVGSVEWWWNPSVSGSNTMAYHFHEGIMTTHAGRVLILDGNFVDMEDNIVQSYVVNQWYHHKLVFDTTSDTYDWYIDGILRVDDGDFLNPVNNIGCTEIKGGWSSIGSCYVDSVGYSWDTDYGVGDNSNEGLLLSYENTTSLAWMGYSLDRQTNKTISGNTTIPLPIDGTHNIQVYGNNSISDEFESNLRFFTIDSTPYINIITPENMTYSEPMEGYYPASYGFENEFDGISGETIDYVDNASISSSCEVKIYDEYQGHKKVLRVHDGNGAGNAGAQDNFASTQTVGSVEWWWNPSVPGSNTMAYHFHEGIKAVHAGRVLIWDGNFVDMEDNIVQSYVVNQWYHHRLVFDTTSDTYDWYIDGILRVDDGDFLNPVNNIGCTEIKGGWSSIGSCYVDSVGYSWDTDYGVGDNSNEGLLLSFDESTSLDWVGYSLDGQTNKTISGNTTIPLPIDGTHNIQIFGNSSLGIMNNPSVRYFTINIFAPTITIKTPIYNDLYGVTAPDFDIEIPDLDLNSTWYSLDGGTTNILFSGLTGTIDQSEWDKIGNGTVTLTFYANDTVNHIGILSVSFRKDIIAPIIIINSPINDEYFSNTSPTFDINISESNLNTTWYSLDNGITNFIFTGLTGTIDQTAWDNNIDDSISIRFYANDSLGTVNFAVVTTIKDTLDPVIMINSPTTGEEFTALPPQFDITIIEQNLDSSWYTIDHGITNFSISGTTAYIDSLAWNDASYGAVTIRFYARDALGREVFEEVIILKNSPPEPTPEIPGYNSSLVVLFIVVSVIGIIRIFKKKLK